MASVSSVSSSSSSIYGNKNVISGLASGMDTESMIENAVSGYKTKISTLQQKRTKVEWQQEVYRSIISKMSSFSDKYTSYASSTNLLSSSFFNQAVKVTSAGKYADMVSASGKTDSSVQILGVKQLAKAATYTVSGIGGKTADKPEFTGSAVDLSEKKELSNVSGSLTIKYGGDRSYTIDFGELDIYKDAKELADAIRSKLGEQTMTLSDGTSVKVSDKIDVKVNGDGNIEFSDKSDAGNTVSISNAIGKIKDTLGIDPSKNETTLNTKDAVLSNKDATLGDYLTGKELTLTLDGVTKKIKLPEPEYKTENGTLTLNVAGYKDKLQEAIKGAFGAGKVTVTAENQNGNSFSLKFSTQEGSVLSASGDTAKALGLDKASTYVNTSKTLGELLDGQKWDTYNRIEYVGDIKEVKNGDGSVYYTDAKGNRLKKDGEKYYRVDGKDEYLYEFKVNDKVVGEFSKDTALETVLTSINGNADVGVKVSYSKTTNQFQFTAKESGASSRIDMGDGLAKALFGDTAKAGKDTGVDKDTGENKKTGAIYTPGQDAIFSMKVNGQLLDGVKRSSNSFDVDGMSLSLKGTFGEYDNTTNKLTNAAAAEADAVSFTASSDADKIVSAIKSMVEDYNAMVTEIKNAYSTLPQQKSNGKYYEPLTEEDKADMSESSIKAYEEKAKQGLLFADRDLSSLYSQLTSAISMSGKDGADLKTIGITSNYSNGLTTLSLNEDKLRAALETDADKVRDVFSKSMDSGASSNGLMQALKSPLDMYSKVQGTKGILVQKAGSTLAPSTLYKNTLQNKLDDIDTQIEKWQDKMADQVDRYTSKFTALEKLIAQMNSQSSALAGFLGTNG